MPIDLGQGLLRVVRNPDPTSPEHVQSSSSLCLLRGCHVPEAPTCSTCEAESTSVCDVLDSLCTCRQDHLLSHVLTGLYSST